MDKSVLVGNDGFLFLSGGNHNVIDFFTGKKNPNTMSINAFVRNIGERKNYCIKNNISKYKHFIFPDKLYVLRNKIDNLHINSLYLQYYQGNTDINNSIKYFAFENYDLNHIYHKTDTHLSANGTAHCVLQMIENLSKEEEKGFIKLLSSNQKKQSIIGDLGGKMQPNISETIISRPIIRTSRRYSNGLKGGNNGIFEITINPEATRNQRLLIFGDSFFRLSLGMLSYFYKEIIFCRTPYLYPEIVSSCSPDIVFTGNAERYLSNVVSDELRKDFFNTPIQLGLNLSIDNEFKKVIKDMFDLSKIKFPVCYNE